MISAAAGKGVVIDGQAFVGAGACFYGCPWCCGDLRGTDGESNLLICVFCRRSVCAINGGAALARCDDCTGEVAAPRNLWSRLVTPALLAAPSIKPARRLDILAKSA